MRSIQSPGSVHAQATFATMRRVLLLVLLTTLCGSKTTAQRLPFYNLGIEQGLIQSQATSLTQDEAGHLWIGTLGGLSRWDGHQFVNYTVRDGLPSNTILSLQSGGQQAIWIGTTKGLALYDGHTFRNYTFSSPDNPQGNNVTAIATKGPSTWCIAGSQLYQIANRKVTAVDLPGAGLRCTALMYDRDTALWIGTAQEGRFYCYRNKTWSAGVSLGREAKTVFSFYQDTTDRQQALCGIVTNMGLQQYGYDGAIAHAIPMKSRIGLQLYSGIQSAAGAFWFAAISGAYFLTEDKYTHYGRKEGFTDSRVNAVFKDREGNIWLASDGQGVYRYSGAPFSILDESDGLSSNQISAFAQDASGALYLGSYEAGINRLQNGVLSRMTSAKDLTVGAMAIAFGKVWGGSRNNGVYYLNGNTWKHYDAVPFNTIISLKTGDDGVLWIGAITGAALLTKDSLHVISKKLNNVTAFLPAGRDSVIISTANGLLLYNNAALSPFITGGLADSAAVQCMARRGNTFFFGSSDNGIIIYNTALHKTTAIGKEEGLHSDFIYNLTLADNGDLWAGTGFGIHCIHFSKNGYSIAFYGQEAGLRGMESNHNATLRLADGSIWFGTTGGAIHYQPPGAVLQSRPAVMISSVLLFGKEINDTDYFRLRSPFYDVPQSLRLPYRENNLTFTFNGILLSGSPLRYRYLLEGTDAQWSVWSASNTVNYSALPSGKYVLRVQCRSSDGSTGNAAPYAFEIITPFHKTALFRLLVLTGCILLGIALQYYAARRRLARERLIERLRRQEQAIVRERTAEDFHDEVGNKITRINVMASVLKSRLGAPSADVLRMIESIQDNAGQLYQGTRDILWSLKPSNDSLYENVNRIIHFGQDLFGDTDVDFTADTPEEGWKELRLPMDASRNLIMIFKEALNNMLKHSGAAAVTLETTLHKDHLRITLRDNGKGFDTESIARGHGLDNMQNRAKRLNGSLAIQSSADAGTTYTLEAKIPQLKG